MCLLLAWQFYLRSNGAVVTIKHNGFLWAPPTPLFSTCPWISPYTSEPVILSRLITSPGLAFLPAFLKMVYYFTSNTVTPSAFIYVGKDKVESLSSQTWLTPGHFPTAYWYNLQTKNWSSMAGRKMSGFTSTTSRLHISTSACQKARAGRRLASHCWPTARNWPRPTALKVSMLITGMIFRWMNEWHLTCCRQQEG